MYLLRIFAPITFAHTATPIQGRYGTSKSFPGFTLTESTPHASPLTDISVTPYAPTLFYRLSKTSVKTRAFMHTYKGKHSGHPLKASRLFQSCQTFTYTPDDALG